ncbi:uncharacterized protein LOC115419218 [Sphaeramia orbicularis]|uniref:uncharacterized protein LOC115419218 n=1 Tax=Sphaeramia orbicularis TaxID=375764 RepID=UPI00117BF70D|nr:uncharacterized protein LOC115419218 [Sphaeramia orbicularis]
MLQPPVPLPSEIWSLVFRYLSVRDKSSVRASCKYFKKLVDHASLWKGWTVVLTFPNGPYSEQFWNTLRRRKVSSAVVRSRRAKHWIVVSVGLPGLSTVVIEGLNRESTHWLKHFTCLKRLAVRSCSSFIRESFVVPQREQLTHLSLCDVDFSFKSLRGFIFSLSRFSRLTSLVYHQRRILDNGTRMIYHILSCRPNLKHLSLNIFRGLGSCSSTGTKPPPPSRRPLALTSGNGHCSNPTAFSKTQKSQAPP